MRSSSTCPKNEPTKWTGRDWERGWQSALRRINGMPVELISRPQIHDFISTLDQAFIHGDSMKFEEALIALLDHCADMVNRGDYQQWW
jgi:hypothetical protein